MYINKLQYEMPINNKLNTISDIFRWTETCSQVYLIQQQNIMSKLSPYRKAATNYTQQFSPVNPNYNQNKTNDKQRSRRGPPVQHTNKQYYNNGSQKYPKLTEKKRYQQTTNINFQQLIEKNQGLANENAELYSMLEERGKIIVVLEKKLEEQVRAQMITLQAIEFEKAKFVQDSHRKFKDYQRKIEQLINEIYLLSEEKEKGNYNNAQQMNALKQTFNQEQKLHFQSIAQNQVSARQISQLQRGKMRCLLQSKNNQIVEIQMEFQAANEKLKNQIIALSNQIVHLNHMRKIQLSQQKIMYQGMLENKGKDYLKDKELLIVQYSIAGKKLESQLVALQSKIDELSQHKKIGEIQQNTREMQLIENNNKLETQLQQVEEFHRRTNFQETQRLKQLNKNEVKVLQASSDALIGNLKTQNIKLINIVNTKSQEIDRLLAQLNTLRAQQALDSAEHDRLVEEMKEKMRQMERDCIEEEERFKIKFAQLREADIRALKQFYEHQIEVLNQDLYEKTNLANKNRTLLHEQLHNKNEMRKNFDIQILKLHSRIGQLQLRLNQKQTEKKQELKSVNDKIQMTSDLLLRETKDKQKLNQMNEQEKQKLYQLIETKDREIEELNNKLALITRNNAIEVAQKNEQIQLLKKGKQDVQAQLKKQKYFYDNQLKKKDILLKSNAEIYRNDIESLKAHQRAEMQLLTKQMATKINNLEVQLNRYRALQKNLKIEMNNLSQSKQVQTKSKSNELQLEKERLEHQRKDSLQKLERHYQAEIGKLVIEIAQLKKQLGYKEEDLRAMNDKYHRLEKKLEMVMESQEKLKVMENRIVALGQDNNLVKNFAEIIKSRSK